MPSVCFRREGRSRTRGRPVPLDWAIGGQMSGCVIPRHDHEDNTQDLQEAFLVKVMREYGAVGQALIDPIRQFWAVQDQLAQTLDAHTFEVMLYRGVEKG
jgi:hypothetical protein